MGVFAGFLSFGHWWFYLEYVISELKYDDNDILFLDVDKVVDIAQRFHLAVVEMTQSSAVMKALEN